MFIGFLLDSLSPVGQGGGLRPGHSPSSSFIHCLAHPRTTKPRSFSLFGLNKTTVVSLSFLHGGEVTSSSASYVMLACLNGKLSAFCFNVAVSPHALSLVRLGHETNPVNSGVADRRKQGGEKKKRQMCVWAKLNSSYLVEMLKISLAMTTDFQVRKPKEFNCSKRQSVQKTATSF